MARRKIVKKREDVVRAEPKKALPKEKMEQDYLKHSKFAKFKTQGEE